MSYKLFIVESPNKCAKIRSYLPSNFKVIASVGHIREIPSKGMNIDVKNDFRPTFVTSPSKKDVVKKIKECSKEADEIFLATDNDMEGEAISWHIWDVLPKRDQQKCSRIVFNEITKKAILSALEKKSKINELKVEAQKARQVLDKLIGYSVSPLLWRNVAHKTSAGRVQSVALNLVATREKQIRNFKPEDYWSIQVELNTPDPFWASVITSEKDNRYSVEDKANKDVELLTGASYKLTEAIRKSKKIKAHPPFDTSSMLQTATAILKWPSKKTTKVAQELYANSYCTYIRTDSFNISEEALASVRTWIKDQHEKKYLPSKPIVYSKKSSSSQEAHECIRPTDISVHPDNITDFNQKKLYKLIRDRFIACQMSPVELDTVTYNIDASCKKKLVAKGQSIKFDGWSSVYQHLNSKQVFLPDLKQGIDLNYIDIDKKTHTTQPPPRYNEGSLIKKMEKEGVGRPSTYSSIMESVKNRGYVNEQKGKQHSLEATDLGLSVNDYLEPHFKNDFIINLSFTKMLEDKIDLIQSGESDFYETVKSTYDKMMGLLKEMGGGTPNNKETGHSCTKCDAGSIIEKQGRFGTFFACSNYPACKTIFIKQDEKFVVKEKQSLGPECPECKKQGRKGNLVVRKNKKKGTQFYGCGNWPKCKHTAQIE